MGEALRFDSNRRHHAGLVCWKVEAGTRPQRSLVPGPWVVRGNAAINPYA